MNEGNLHGPGFAIKFEYKKKAIMAQSTTSVILHTMRGAIGKQIVVKQYRNKTVITAYPDMSNVKPSKLQKQKRKKFAAAIGYAQSIINDPVKKAAYAKKLKRGARVYNAAIKEYLARNERAAFKEAKKEDRIKIQKKIAELKEKERQKLQSLLLKQR